MLKTKVNKTIEFTVDEVNHQLFIDHEAVSTSIEQLNSRTYHLILNGKTYTAEVLKVEAQGKSMLLKINGQFHQVNITDKYDVIKQRIGYDNTKKTGVKTIYAPMPGLISNILVKEGDEVQEGTPLLILEAMKMENAIIAEGKGIVKSIHVKNGGSVEKGALLVEFKS